MNSQGKLLLHSWERAQWQSSGSIHRSGQREESGHLERHRGRWEENQSVMPVICLLHAWGSSLHTGLESLDMQPSKMASTNIAFPSEGNLLGIIIIILLLF